MISTVAVGGMFLLAAGCPLRQYDTEHQPSLTAARAHALVTPLAAYDQLGDAWQQLNGAASVHDVYAAPDAKRALIRLRGWGGPALWYEDGTFTQTMLGHEPAFVDPAQGLMFKVEPQAEGQTDRLISYRLPRREQQSAQPIPRGEVLSLASQPGEHCAWFSIYRRADEGRDASLEVGWVDAETLFGFTLKMAETGAEPIAVQIVPLAAGGAVVDVDGALYHVMRDGQQRRLAYEPPAARGYSLSADQGNAAVLWVLGEPQTDGMGTGREAGESQPGELIAVHLDNGELARLPTGRAGFTKAAGDWDNRRALLVQAQTGVALADFTTGELTWLLRQSADTPAYLLPGGQVWAFGTDSVVQISADELIALAPKLAASELLTRDQAEVIKPLTKRLGWKWQDTQVSPLTGAEGSIAFFNTGNLDSSLAEFHWDLQNERASELHIARKPLATDRNKLERAAEQPQQPIGKPLLAALGWPDALWLEADSYLSSDEVRVLYELAPDQDPPGTFTLWITAEATFMQLDAQGTFDPAPAPAEHDEAADIEGHMHGEGSEPPEQTAETGN